ncbi:MAG TPA: S41 family peptidase [Candidatus Solibacter sp.]|nr:S41 family peptidase [Candidatus Solibacter sp.]
MHIRTLASLIVLVSIGASPGLAQLTLDQKFADFQALAALYAKRYGPMEWKRDALGVDLFNIGTWLEKVQASKDDLDFYEIMVDYVASLNDAHSGYSLPSNFQASLGFTVDLYDGKLLVDSISRSRLPASDFGFQVGYELVSIDGQDAQKILDGLLRYEIAANPRSTRRLAAMLLPLRPQSRMPHAADVPDVSSVVFRTPADDLQTYAIPWLKTGLPLTAVGQYVTPGATGGAARPAAAEVDLTDDQPAYLDVLNRLQNCRLPDRAVLGFGAQVPVFTTSLLPGFTQRLGKTSADIFYSGVFDVSGHKVGYIRIPSFSPSSTTLAVALFQIEIAYFQANTDALVVDVMRNPGGSGSYVNALLAYVMPTQWRAIPFELRATSEWVVAISSSVVAATGATDQKTVALLTNIKNEITAANHAMRGRTNPIPLDDIVIDRQPATDSKGNVIAYTKPITVLVDELTASAGDVFAATIQDNARGQLFGYRTMGAGGNVESWYAGSYSLGIASVTESLMNRKNPIVTDEYPAAPYVENIGVRPEIVVDYMTRDNLLQGGKPFLDALVAVVSAQIQKGK